jgi:hypothetical protein
MINGSYFLKLFPRLKIFFRPSAKASRLDSKEAGENGTRVVPADVLQKYNAFP